MTEASTRPNPSALALDLEDQQRMILETVNDLYEDATLLVGRILCDRRAATQVRALSVTIEGIELLVTDGDGDLVATVPFPEPLTDIDGLWLLFFGVVVNARELSGERGTTSVEKVIASANSFQTFITRVVAVTDVTPHLRQITFGGGDLVKLTPVGPDTFLYLLLPPPGHTELTIDGTFSWEAAREMPPELQPVGAYYTLRHWRPEVAELDILMVLHGDAGPSSAWAQRAAVGDPVALWGPRTAWLPPVGTDRYLLVADETGLPAVAVILETLPDGTPIHVVAEVAYETNRLELREADHIVVTWLQREGIEAGTTTLLADAVKAMAPPDGKLYVWGGAESRAMTTIRRHVRDTWGFAQDQVSLVAYWRHQAHTNE